MNRRTFIETAIVGGVATLVPPSLSAALSRPVRAFVTADADAHVAVVDPVRGRVVRRLRTLALPRSIETVGDTAVVAHSELGKITLIDGATFERRVLAGRLGEPRYTVAHPDGRHALVSDSALGQIIVVDVRGARIVARVNVGAGARHLSVNPLGSRLWTALGTKAERIAVVDVANPLRPRLVRTIAPPFLAHDIVFSPDGSRIWVTSGDRGTIAIYDARRRIVIRRIPALAPPQHLAFSERGNVAYVASGDDGSMRVHDLDGRLLVSSRIPVGSFNVARGGGHVVTPSLERGTLCLLDRHGRRPRTIQVATAAHDVCVMPGI